jgi:hypothetical protein
MATKHCPTVTLEVMLPRPYEKHEWVTVQCIILTTSILLKFREKKFPTQRFLFKEFKISVRTPCSYTVNLELLHGFELCD